MDHLSVMFVGILGHNEDIFPLSTVSTKEAHWTKGNHAITSPATPVVSTCEFGTMQRTVVSMLAIPPFAPLSTKDPHIWLESDE